MLRLAPARRLVLVMPRRCEWRPMWSSRSQCAYAAAESVSILNRPGVFRRPGG